MNQPSFKLIPPVDSLLDTPEIGALKARYPRFPWTRCIREVLGGLRRGGLAGVGASRDEVTAAVVDAVLQRVGELQAGGLRRVFNGTGVILHTNLGRAVLGGSARRAADEAMGHYVNLEIDLHTGKRSGRGDVLRELITTATGAEAAMVVNNNAAAVYLVVGSYSPPGRVLISRGELVEIGGSFRLPDILQRAATEMIEVGTTNRTYIDDYAREARPGDILMRAHRSNYDIQGFTHDTTVSELVALAREQKCHVVYDLGSGSLYDYARMGIEGEERVADVLSSGVDCVTMSGDKLLGGPQAGIILGRKKFLDRLERNPLRRAVRVDKVVIAAMQAVMRSYLFGDDGETPTLSLAVESVEVLRRRAEAIARGLAKSVGESCQVGVVDDDAALGGGSFAVQQVPSVALVFRCPTDGEASSLALRMRNGTIPILCRIKGNEVRLNMRAILPEDDGPLTEALNTLFE